MASLLLALLLSPWQGPEWVVEEVRPPLSPIVGDEVLMQPPEPQGDFDGDGLVDGFLYANTMQVFEVFYGLFHGPGAGETTWMWKPFFAGLDLPMESCLIHTPLGPGMVSRDLALGNYLTVRRLVPPFDVLVSVYPVPFQRLMRADDVDGDGWEEVFYAIGALAQADRTIGLLDGATLAPIWEYRGPFADWGELPPRTWVGPMPDLDGDGVGDVMVQWMIALGGTLNDLVMQSSAHSGVDGHVLWSNSAPGGGFQNYPASGLDFTGDGVMDLILSGGRTVRAVDGATGAILWDQVEPDWIHDSAPEGMVAGGIHASMLTRDPTGRVVATIVMRYQTAYPSNDYTMIRAIHHVDAATGVWLGMATMPENLQPWFPEPFHDWEWEDRYWQRPLGDVDRDGLGEYVFQVAANLYDEPGVGSNPPSYLVTLGQRTLWAPERVKAGGRFRAEVRIPSSPGHDFFLLASRTFDRRGGVEVDGWKTHLASDAWLTRTLTSRALSGTLDAEGHGVVEFTLPLNPALAGTALYTKAVVLEPGTTDQVWTMSTLGRTEIMD